jgi:hypothetical protein
MVAAGVSAPPSPPPDNAQFLEKYPIGRPF